MKMKFVQSVMFVVIMIAALAFTANAQIYRFITVQGQILDDVTNVGEPTVGVEIKQETANGPVYCGLPLTDSNGYYSASCYILAEDGGADTYAVLKIRPMTKDETPYSPYVAYKVFSPFTPSGRDYQAVITLVLLSPYDYQVVSVPEFYGVR